MDPLEGLKEEGKAHPAINLEFEAPETVGMSQDQWEIVSDWNKELNNVGVEEVTAICGIGHVGPLPKMMVQTITIKLKDGRYMALLCATVAMELLGPAEVPEETVDA